MGIKDEDVAGPKKEPRRWAAFPRRKDHVARILSKHKTHRRGGQADHRHADLCQNPTRSEPSAQAYDWPQEAYREQGQEGRPALIPSLVARAEREQVPIIAEKGSNFSKRRRIREDSEALAGEGPHVHVLDIAQTHYTR